MKLINPTKEQLNIAFAERVAGWKLQMNSAGNIQPKTAKEKWVQDWDFTDSMDAVLPYLESDWGAEIEYGGMNEIWYVSLLYANGNERAKASDTSLPTACVIALLRANGVEVEYTEDSPQ